MLRRRRFFISGVRRHSGSAPASRQVIEQAKSALQASKEQLAKQGMAMVEATARRTIPDDDMRKIGEMFGANRRRDAIQPESDQGQVPNNQV